jgi:hypothetical protein
MDGINKEVIWQFVIVVKEIALLVVRDHVQEIVVEDVLLFVYTGLYVQVFVHKTVLI